MWRKCIKGWTHDWEKWRPYSALTPLDVRRCTVCGFKQQRWMSF